MEFFGLDIGSHTIKAVQLARKGDRYQLIAFGSAASTPKWLLSEAESDLTALAQTIKKLYQETKITTRNVSAALPQDEVFTRVITLPWLSEEELTSALKWEAEQYIPLPLEEVTLAHQIVRESNLEGKKQIEVLLVAAPNRLIEKTLKIFKVAELNPVSLETEIFAIARSLVPSDSGTVMVVDLGAKATDLAIVENGQVIFTYSMATAGDALTRAIAYGLDLDPSQAEAYKKAYGIDPKKLEGKIEAAIAQVLEAIIKEMEKTIQFFQAKGKTINRVILTGGTANLPELASFLAKKLSLEIQVGNPFARVIEDSLLAKITAEDAPLYTVAVGLAMKEID